MLVPRRRERPAQNGSAHPSVPVRALRVRAFFPCSKNGLSRSARTGTETHGDLHHVSVFARPLPCYLVRLAVPDGRRSCPGRGGRVAYRGGLLSRCTGFYLYPGFESLPLRLAEAGPGWCGALRRAFWRGLIEEAWSWARRSPHTIPGPLRRDLGIRRKQRPERFCRPGPFRYLGSATAAVPSPRPARPSAASSCSPATSPAGRPPCRAASTGRAASCSGRASR